MLRFLRSREYNEQFRDTYDVYFLKRFYSYFISTFSAGNVRGVERLQKLQCCILYIEHACECIIMYGGEWAA